MVNGLWGKKIGMTQIFSADRKVVPVTVIDLSDWYVTQVKTQERDGYSAVQVGCLKKRYAEQDFSSEWLSSPQKYFSDMREVRGIELETDLVGKPADTVADLAHGEKVDIFGTTIGRGFQGGVKRHGFHGGRGSHGDKLGRKGGSLSGMRRQGRVIKGKRMPGHMGVDQRIMRNLEVIRVEQEARVVMVRGSVPGKTGSLVFVRKRK